uniref:Uncharacterized protein n=1 Tax=Arundo donax TaxID=35708 RepID=A0A0A8YAW0_ARUDO
MSWGGMCPGLFEMCSDVCISLAICIYIDSAPYKKNYIMEQDPKRSRYGSDWSSRCIVIGFTLKMLWFLQSMRVFPR